MLIDLPDQNAWRRKFAWWPVVTLDNKLVWLAMVEARYLYSSWWDDYYEYRVAQQ